MCGLAGFAYIQGSVPPKPDSLLSLETAADSIRHRGPDDQGVWMSECGRVGLAHRRLSILDLSPRGHQPMADPAGNVLTYNGEVYNFEELKSVLPSSDFVSHSDTEVVLKGLAQFSDAWISKLDGMFAFAFYSSRKKEFVFAVDPAGEKPLYTYWDGKLFAFASEMKALLSFPSVNRAISREQLKETLIYGYVPCPLTMYRFIRKLPAGHFQKVSLVSGPGPVTTYWDLPIGQSHLSLSFDDAVHQTRELLAKAVKKRLIADVPVGCFLSGGLDSSAVAYEAARILPAHSLKTFAAGFSGDAYRAIYDETSFADLVAQRIHSQHQVLQVRAAEIDAKTIMQQFDEPFGDSSAIPTYLLCRETSRHLKVVLSGDGGDELFGGYRRFCAAILSEKYRTLWKLALAPVSLFPASRHSLLSKIKRFQSAVSYPLIKRLIAWNAFFKEEELRRFIGEYSENHLATLQHWDDKTQGLPIGEKILYYNFKTYLFDDLLPKVDRMSMAHGLEVRSPFLDKAFIDFAFRLPTKFKFNAIKTKIVLKSAYQNLLGRDITHRPKHGFAFPLETFMGKQSKLDQTRLTPTFWSEREALSEAKFTNATSKKFMIWCLNQSFSKMEASPGYAS